MESSAPGGRPERRPVRDPVGDPVKWREGDPRLAPRAELALARATIAAYLPRDERQARERARILDFVDAHPDALLRTCLAGHLTTSVLLVDATGARALLTLHKKLGRWLQLGGHCDGDANLAGSALREARDESGIAGIAIDPCPIDLDVHKIPARPGEPEHDHLDVRFAACAPAGARERVSEESRELRWVAPAELGALSTDDSVRRLFELVLPRSAGRQAGSA